MEGMGVPLTSLSLSGNTLISASRSAYYLKIWNLSYDRQHTAVTPFHNRSTITGLTREGNSVCFPKTGESNKVVIWNAEEGDALGCLGYLSSLNINRKKGKDKVYMGHPEVDVNQESI